MCVSCGCGSDATAVLSADDHVRDGEHEHVHADGTRHRHAHGDAGHQHPPLDHVHGHGTVDGRGEVQAIQQRILDKNQLIAERNRGWFAGRQVLALNLVSSPGAGKTTLLERTIRDLHAQVPTTVIEGDQATSNDAQRIRAAGARSVQVNTGTGCHLEADMVERALAMLAPPASSLLFIENVGNLVCPALFDLGEHAKVVIYSVTEGEDKPLKYPHMFAAASLVLLNKVDLLPHLDFDMDKARANAREVNPAALVLPVSARTGTGLAAWYDWLLGRREAS